MNLREELNPIYNNTTATSGIIRIHNSDDVKDINGHSFVAIKMGSENDFPVYIMTALRIDNKTRYSWSNIGNEFKESRQAEAFEPEYYTVSECLQFAISIPFIKVYMIDSVLYNNRLNLLATLITNRKTI